MLKLKAHLICIFVLSGFVALGAPKPLKPSEIYRFTKAYRIEHYLDLSIEMQKLEPRQRAVRLKEIASDKERASEVFPLCRMLFEAKPNGKFLRPGIGAASFFDGGTYADWPLDPITIFEQVPILVVTGWYLAGVPESPESYVEYCLTECQWRTIKYKAVTPEERKNIVEKFIAANPKSRKYADWLRGQTR